MLTYLTRSPNRRARGRGTDRGRTGETEKGRRQERRRARPKDGQKEAVEIHKHYWPRVYVAERREGT